MRPRTPDRRTKRTAHALHVALNTLVLEKGYSAVSVKEITDRANVGRSTFYEHHGSKEGLLLHGLDHLRAALASPAPAQSPDPLRPTLLFFTHVSAYRDLFRALAAGPAGEAVVGKMKRILGAALARHLPAASHRGTPAIPRDLLIQFALDAAFSVLTWWLEQRPELTAAEIDHVYRQLVSGAIPGAIREA